MFWRKKIIPKVTFATTVWEKDWRFVLQTSDYLSIKQIANHQFFFSEKLLIINNVEDLSSVKKVACRLIDEGILSRFVVVDEIVEEMLLFFGLKREDFRSDHGKVSDWVYYNALGPLAALYSCQSEYLLYHTGDVRLDRAVDWIPKAIDMMEKYPIFKVANLLWNGKTEEARRESYKKRKGFYFAKDGFSDQQFLVKKETFCQPIYQSIHPESGHFPRGEVFERRAYSAMREKGWQRLIFSHGSYTHENV